MSWAFMQPDFRVERTSDCIVVRSISRIRWIGVIIIAVALLFFFIAAPKVGSWPVVLELVWFLGFGLPILLFLEVTTTFDLRSRRVVRTLTFVGYQHRRDYSVEEVASVGVRTSNHDGLIHTPAMRFRNGRIRSLNFGTLTYGNAAGVVDEICAAAGLNRDDIAPRADSLTLPLLCLILASVVLGVVLRERFLVLGDVLRG